MQHAVGGASPEARYRVQAAEKVVLTSDPSSAGTSMT